MHNLGLLPVPLSTSGIYLSTNSVISTGDRLLRWYYTPSIAAGQNVNQNLSVRVPTDIPFGRCYVGVYADYQDKIAEENENDNASKALAVTCVGRPDLVVSAISAPTGSAWRAGTTENFRVSVKNIGVASAPSSLVSLHLSPNAAISTTKQFLGGAVVPALAPNASANVTITIEHPWCYRQSGPHYIGAYADARLDVPEQSEGNNTRVLAPRPLARYAGSRRRAEFTTPLLGNLNGPTTWTTAGFKARQGASAGICITAPSYGGYVVVPIWSASSGALVFDVISDVSLQLPLYVPPAVVVTSGYADLTFNLPPVPGFTGTIHAYMHTVWFTPTWSLDSLSGTNRLLHRITP